MESVEPYVVLAPVALYGLGALAVLVDRSAKASHVAAVLGSVLGVVLSLRTLLAGSTQQFAGFAVTPFANMSFRLDPLAAFFLLVIGLIGAMTSLYALGYVGHTSVPSASLGVMYNGFLAALVLVVLAESVFAFLFAWEAMALTSLFLVVHHHHQHEARRAGFIYVVMTHAGTACLLVAFLILFAYTGSLDFAAFRAAGTALPAGSRDLIFVLALIAFGTKAGVIPLHIWLPRAHPAAPSHVSALMSGVMLKTAVYGLLRVGWEFVGPGPLWWGGLVLALGTISAVLGVLYALMEHDLKRLLAYHS
ncbi:MAG: hydrogenase 4 subunit B, partial [Chloroflexi bacterium]|nr:hydrogenase 4 subunit B [Chloroflexota bacterium]